MSQGSPPQEPPPSRGQWLSHRVDSLFQDLIPFLDLPSSTPQASHPIQSQQLSQNQSQTESSERGFSKASTPPRDCKWEFNGPDADAALGKALGVENEMMWMGGSVFKWSRVAPGEVSKLREGLSKQLDGAWSTEALHRGVAQARAGDYEAAGQSYDQALSLDSTNADALVARGAARANQGQLRLALEDMEAALALKPNDKNATKYKALIEARLEAASVPAKNSNRGPAAKGKVLEYRSGGLVSSSPVRDDQQLPEIDANMEGKPEGSTCPDTKIQDAIDIIEKDAKRKHAKKRERKHKKKKSKRKHQKTESSKRYSKRSYSEKRRRSSRSSSLGSEEEAK